MQRKKYNFQRSFKSALLQSGLSMIEVLVTLFILTIGLFGVASLQFVASFSNADALNRTQAVLIAQQFTERLNASAYTSNLKTGLVVNNTYFNSALYNFDNLTCLEAEASPYNCHCMSHPAAVPNCQADDCGASEMAEFDAYQMSCAVAQNNPNALLTLSCLDKNSSDTDWCTAGSMHEVIISWPVRTWQGKQRILNPKCNAIASDSNDCVVVSLIL